MTFPYPINTAIPTTGHYPGNDQPGMQVNFANINGYLGVDHVLPNTNPGAGFHKQVTFNSTNPPSVPTIPPVLFTNTQDGAAVPNTLPGGIAGLFFYSGSQAQGQRQNVVATNGSVVMFGGIILKWGQISMVASSKVFTYPQAFPNNTLSVSLTSLSTTPAVNGILTFDAVSAAGFTVFQQTGNPLTVFYIAIGN